MTQKTQDKDSSDEEPERNEVIPGFALSQDPMNPWMLKRSDKSNVDEEFDFGYKKYVQGRMFKKKDDSDSDDNEPNVLVNLKEGVRKMNELDVNVQDNNINAVSEISEEKSYDQEVFTSYEGSNKAKRINIKANTASVNIAHNDGEPQTKKNKKSLEKASKKKGGKVTKLIATSNWIVESVMDNDQSKVGINSKTKNPQDILTAFDSLEDAVTDKVEQKLQKLRKNIEKLEKTKPNKAENTKEKKVHNDLEYFKMRNQKIKAIIDEELIETASQNVEDNKYLSKPLSEVMKTVQVTTSQENTNSNIDPSRFIKVKPKYLNTALPGENDYDVLDDDEQVVPKVNIEEVFEEDDVVDSFRQEKENEINKNKSEDIDLSLPGWGAWGGKGVKPTKRKKNRFILKGPPQMPRRDENKGDIIIKEYKDPKLQLHKVSDVPFPFTTVKDYEASIRAPLGNTFIPENAHKKLIKPSVITKAGVIIDPMDEDELLEKRNCNFKNKSVLKLLGQK